MRKVKPEDEIPIVDLSLEAIENRRVNGKPVSDKTIKRFMALDRYVQIKQDKNEAVTIADFMPRLFKIADMLNTELSGGRHVCRKGCAWCCKVPVTVTAVEAAYIHSVYGVPMNTLSTPPRVRLKVDDYCPLLDQETGTCSVYEARPLACRSFFTYDDPKYCVDPTTDHLISSANSHNTLKHLVAMLYALSENSPYVPQADVRDWVIKK